MPHASVEIQVVKQEEDAEMDDLACLSPDSRALAEQLDDSPESRALLAQLVEASRMKKLVGQGPPSANCCFAVSCVAECCLCVELACC